MGEAFISRRGTSEAKLTFDLARFGNNTPSRLVIADFYVSPAPASRMAGCQNNFYALFAGGSSGRAKVFAFNAALIALTPTELSVGRESMGAAQVGDYCLFAGGSASNVQATVDAYNASLVRSTPTALSQAVTFGGAAKVGDYALFAGGINSDFVQAYNSSLVRSTPTVLSVKRNGMGAASNRNYAIFAGGSSSGGNHNTVDAYNASLTRSTPTGLSLARTDVSGASMGGLFAVFAGGEISGSTPRAVVDAYDLNLTRVVLTDLSRAVDAPASASFNGYALFLGGDGTVLYDLNAYTLGKMIIPVPKGSTYELNSMYGTAANDMLLEVGLPATGWIKLKSNNFIN
ncbi:hypothetical protein [Thermoclostridium caenicola]|uniref:Uncharacterized protein n=1 Tax=Thermoclostridium caenicola TaxID=659425 RepID=A0A1M6KIM8_9FIRM|nr:hypothetical protein [Thermoclostridium caenicola]SHJ58731.1 hypothetical protein SAMN05444373_10812 [Thermoclostridium caenicola]